jgi:hypothetical protein
LNDLFNAPDGIAPSISDWNWIFPARKTHSFMSNNTIDTSVQVIA